MHEHDLELIAEYAQGSLPSRAEEARRLIARCETCAAEFRTQRAMRSMLEALPPVSMSDDERIRLREGVLGAIPASPAMSPGAAPPSRAWFRRWYALGSVAAVLLAVVGLVGVLSNMQGGDDTADLAVPPAEEAATDGDGAAIESLRPSDDTATAAADTAEDDGEMAAMAGGEERFAPVIEDLGTVDRAELDTAIEQALAQVESSPLPAQADPPEDAPAPRCTTEVDQPIAVAILAVMDGEPIEVYVLVPDSAGTTVKAFAPPTCESRTLD